MTVLLNLYLELAIDCINQFGATWGWVRKWTPEEMNSLKFFIMDDINLLNIKQKYINMITLQNVKHIFI